MKSQMSIIKYLIFFILLFFSSNIFALDLLNNPESIVYDSLRNRYLVSNWGHGHIVQIDSAGTQSYLITNQQCYAGLHIQDDILYVACREYGVKGFDLSDNSKILDVQIPGTTNINDITADISGNLYVSYPTGSQIFKININDQTYSTFVDSGLGTPNGLYFDEQNNRLLIISYQNFSPVQAVYLADSTLSTVTTTNLHGLDGLTRDNEGNYYASSWYNNAVYRFDSTFINSPELFSTHPDDPADIYFDKQNNLLAVPLFFTHAVEFVSLPTSIDEKDNHEIADGFVLKQNFPNPFNPVTTITYSIPRKSYITLRVYDILGREVVLLINEEKMKGNYDVEFNASELPSGVYFYKLQTEKYIETKKMIFMK
ncbi:MAG: T9SS type A sorting domain-containing protein [Bacteroidales bacterium]|nr:T9SS type A sorting domain-containing protein [Bacteroidales bacterium]